jgi:nitrate reductase NapAB chaperone NapD
MKNDREFPVELAEKIVKMLHDVTGDNVNFMDQRGMIIATMQPKRLQTIHQGAKEIMSGKIDELAISVEAAQKLSGVMPGYNGVVYHREERLACIGLSGDPEKMRPLQKLAAIIVQEEYTKFLSAKTKQDILGKVAGEVQEMSAAIDQIAAGSMDNLQHSRLIEEMADNAESYLRNIDRTLGAVKNIGNQTRLLGLNAMIEAARAGEQGKGFIVVAQEMEKLSNNSIKSLKNITEVLNEVQSSITLIAERIRNSTAIAREQSDALQNIRDGVMEIQLEAEKLIEGE